MSRPSNSVEHSPQQLNIFDICKNRHRGNAESENANESIHDSKAMLRRSVLEFIRAQGEHGATCQEIADNLGLLYPTASARCSELKARNQVSVTERRRLTRSGRSAAVLIGRQ